MHPERGRNPSVHQVALDAPGILFGQQEPQMQFPQNTFFMPYGYLHNTSAQSRQVLITASATGQAYTITSLTLAPHETEKIDYKDALKNLKLPPTTTIDISASYTGNDGDILIEEGSVDQTGNYVFEVEPQAEGWTISRTICDWELHDETDSMISLWNYSSSAEDLKLTLYYAGGQYVLPIHLAPQQDYELDLATLVHSAQPDAKGSIIPQSITEGSAILADASDPRNHVFVASSSAVFNVRTGTCSPTCQYCNGVSEIAVLPSPTIVVGVGSTTTAGVQLTYNTGEVTGGTPYSWYSNNTAITTVNSSGVVTGVAVGSNDIDADFIDLPSPAGYICLVGNCPTYGGGGSGPVSSGITIFLDTTSCQMNGTSEELSASWANQPLNGCSLSALVTVGNPSTDGGSCQQFSTTHFDNPRLCYSTSKNNCQIITCPTGSRVATNDCTGFLDTTAADVTSIPADCTQ